MTFIAFLFIDFLDKIELDENADTNSTDVRNRKRRLFSDSDSDENERNQSNLINSSEDKMDDKELNGANSRQKTKRRRVAVIRDDDEEDD